jgi:hypothetical protein
LNAPSAAHRGSDALLAQPNPAVIAVVRPDGQPVSVATWYLVDEDGRILVNMDIGRKRNNDYTRQNPLKDGAWYTHISVQGRIYAVARRSGLRRHRPAVASLRERPLLEPLSPAGERAH